MFMSLCKPVLRWSAWEHYWLSTCIGNKSKRLTISSLQTWFITVDHGRWPSITVQQIFCKRIHCWCFFQTLHGTCISSPWTAVHCGKWWRVFNKLSQNQHSNTLVYFAKQELGLNNDICVQFFIIKMFSIFWMWVWKNLPVLYKHHQIHDVSRTVTITLNWRILKQSCHYFQYWMVSVRYTHTCNVSNIMSTVCKSQQELKLPCSGKR